MNERTFEFWRKQAASLFAPFEDTPLSSAAVEFLAWDAYMMGTLGREEEEIARVQRRYGPIWAVVPAEQRMWAEALCVAAGRRGRDVMVFTLRGDKR